MLDSDNSEEKLDKRTFSKVHVHSPPPPLTLNSVQAQFFKGIEN